MPNVHNYVKGKNAYIHTKFLLLETWSPDSNMTKPWAGSPKKPRFNFLAGERNFSLLKNIQTSTAALISPPFL